VALAALDLQLRGGVNGFYDNGGGKSYVYLMGVQDLDVLHP
jgi:hypothetical protein